MKKLGLQEIDWWHVKAVLMETVTSNLGDLLFGLEFPSAATKLQAAWSQDNVNAWALGGHQPHLGDGLLSLGDGMNPCLQWA